MYPQIRINNRTVGIGHPVYVIAEMACAHHGSLEKALKLVDVAVEAEVDAVQLQFFSRDHLMSVEHPAYDLLGKLSFSEDEWRKIYDHARKYSMDVFVCTYDTPSAEFAIRLGVEGIKLNSSDLSNHDLLETVARSGIPFTIGTGASTVEEISEALARIKDYQKNAILMHGMQAFPTEIADANINKIKIFQSCFNLPVGYQDHTSGDDAFAGVIDLLAIGAGACVVEKHYTLDRSLKETDYQAALNPQELNAYVKRIRTASTAMGETSIQPLSEAERNYRKFQKKQIVARKNLTAGSIISKEDLSFLRTGKLNGYSPDKANELLGKKIIQNISKGAAFLAEYVEGCGQD
ncbi:N-acetylneuraminate synthase family protein [Maridesulfovibrio sp.]|uniref:N-acetylneuraminate synthase family protein n=1 Tax=Maridesulfovibrio sp. TaxID=2795000 RepID=UPI0039F06533